MRQERKSEIIFHQDNIKSIHHQSWKNQSPHSITNMENLTPGIIASHNTAGKQHSENTHKIQNPVPRQSRVRKSIGKTRCDAEAKKVPRTVTTTVIRYACPMDFHEEAM